MLQYVAVFINLAVMIVQNSILCQCTRANKPGYWINHERVIMNEKAAIPLGAGEDTGSGDECLALLLLGIMRVHLLQDLLTHLLGLQR